MPLHDPSDAAGALKDVSLGETDPDFMHEKPRAHSVELPPVYEGKGTLTTDMVGEDFPTEEELHTLRRVADKIPWRVYTIAFVELCERFSYYGTTVVFTNFIQQPRQTPTGAADGVDGQAGALGMGQRASTGITTFNSFWVYCTPLLGAYIADTYTGRFNAIAISLAIAIAGHIILVASAAPSVLAAGTGGTLACFIIGLIIMGVGTGGFKPNISPLIAEQIPRGRMTVIQTKSGERVIVDPAVTSSRIYHYFYMFINIGALIGQIGMTYAEKYVGFWLAYLMPTVLLMLCPFVMYACKKMYNLTPPEGSVFGKSMKLFALANKGRWSVNPVTTHKRLHDGTFWENVKPSRFTAETRPAWMNFDDAWVDEVARGFAACSVFLWYPLYWLAYSQLNNNLTSQAAVMTLNGIPNDVLSNLDPFALIILIPVVDLIVYPGLRKAGINFTPIKKITLGFFTGTAAMIWACVIQAYIYKDSECGVYASDSENCDPVGINVWAQTGSYVLIAISEILASITSLEYAFSKAPKNMRSLVMSFNLFMSAIASAISEGFVSLAADPLLVWNYGVVAVLSFIGGIGFYITYRQLDRDEDKLNMLPSGHLADAGQLEHVEEQRRLSVTGGEAEKV